MPRRTSDEVIRAFAEGAQGEYWNSTKSLTYDSDDNVLMLGRWQWLAVRIDPEKNCGVEYVINGDRMRSGWGGGPGAFQRSAISALHRNVQLPAQAFDQAFHDVQRKDGWARSNGAFMDAFRMGYARLVWNEGDRSGYKCRVCGAEVVEENEAYSANGYTGAMPMPKLAACGHDKYFQTTRRHRVGFGYPKRFETVKAWEANTQWWHRATSCGVVLRDPLGTDHYFVSSWDENESQHYFLCETPFSHDGYADAIEKLKPDAVRQAEREGRRIVRQGDIFAIQTDYTYHPKRAQALKRSAGLGNVIHGTRHYADFVMEAMGGTYAHGRMWHITSAGGMSWGRPRVDGRHRTVWLDGPTLWRLEKNTALRGWQVSGGVD